MLNEIFKSILLTSIVGSVLAAALLLLKPITKRWFGSKWQYYIWMMILVVHEIRKNSTIMICDEIGTKKIITRKTKMIDAPLMIGFFKTTYCYTADV